MHMKWYQALANPRILTVFLLGFSSGLPLALTTATLSAWFTEAHIGLLAIGSLSLVGQPYVYKFLWAPLMDRFIPPFMGRRRGWILITQFLLIMTIAAMACFNPEQHAELMGLLALLIAFCSASQDISINAYQTDVLHQEELGFGASLNVLGYRIAMVVSGAFALILAQYAGWHLTYSIMSALMLIGVFTSWFGPEVPDAKQQTPGTLKSAVIEPFVEFFQRKGPWLATALLLIIILYKMGDAFALSLNTTFLLRGVHFSLADVGVANKGVGLIANIAGGLIAGIILTRIRLFYGLIIFGFLQALSNLSYMLLAHVGHNYSVMLFAISSEYFCSGLGTAAFLALIMQICNARYTATQFALLSALSAVGRVYVGPVAAVVVEHVGWTWFYFWSFIIALPGTLLIFVVNPFLKNDAE